MSGFYLPTPVRRRMHVESLAVLQAEGKGIRQASPGTFSERSAPVPEALEPSPSRCRPSFASRLSVFRGQIIWRMFGNGT